MHFLDTLGSSTFLSSKPSEDTTPVPVLLKQHPCSERELSYRSSLADNPLLLHSQKQSCQVELANKLKC